MSRKLLSVNDSQPLKLLIRRGNPPTDATALYMVVADHGWCERIICSDCYPQDANDISKTLGKALGIPYETVAEPETKKVQVELRQCT